MATPDQDLRRLLELDGGSGPAPPIGDAAADKLVGGALDAVFGPGPAGGGGAGGGGALAVKAAAVLLVIAAAAGGWWFFTPREPLVFDQVVLTAGVVEPEPEAIVVIDAGAPVEIEITIPVRRPTPDRPAPEKPVEKAEDLLAAANAARARKAWRDADTLYARVVADHRGSPAAQVASVASATLHLEHLGDPAGAASRFKKALRGGTSGPVAEEARYGLAEAYHALHDDDAEARALDDFLAHHPDSALADRARARRKALAP